ncbi:MAG TPA: hypothetical protein VFK69_02650 [Candidatus Eisenbacteria bacterium]|nr:hypothetical protein [Candidatus Eisenbacteria bacterium]
MRLPHAATRVVRFALAVLLAGALAASSAAKPASAATTARQNAPPQATNLNTPEVYTEDTPLNLTDIVVSDDDPVTTATLVLSNPAAGSLTTGTIGSTTSTYNPGAGTWTASGPIPEVNSLLADVTFIPAPNFNASFLMFTSVSDGFNPPVNGVKNMTGIAVDDPPQATNLSVPETYTEDVPLNLADIVVSDIDNFTTQVSLTLSNPTAGSLTTATSGGVTSTYIAAAGTWTASGAIPDVNALLAGVTFVPAPNFNGGFSIATSVSDGIAPPLTGTKFITGLPVNDPPQATNLSAGETYTEDVPLNLIDIVVSDVDNNGTTATLTMSNPGAGILTTGSVGGTTATFGAGVWSASGPIANVNALLAGVTFVPAANFNATFTILTSVTDGISAPVTGSKVMTGVPVNDPPQATNLNAAETYTEDTPLDLIDIVVSDIDSPVLIATLTLSDPAAGSLTTTTSGSTTSTYNALTGVWTSNGPIADVNALLASVSFVPAPNGNGAFSISTSVSDGIAPALTGTKAVTGIAVNDAPALDISKLPAMQPVQENAAAPPIGGSGTPVSNLVDFAVPTGQVDNVTDPDAGALLGIAVVAVDPHVIAYYSTNGGATWTVMGSVGLPNARLLAADGVTRIFLQPAPNFYGSLPNALSFRAWDRTSGSNGGLADASSSGGSTAFSIAIGAISQFIVHVDQSPQATNLSASEVYVEDTPLDLANIVVSDPDDANTAVTLTLSTAAGVLTTATSGSVTSTFANGVWNASGPIADVNVLLAAVTFVPAPNFNASFAIGTQVSDGVLAVSGTKNVTGIPVNDAPVLDASKTPTIPAVQENSGAPVGAVGALVSTLVDPAIPSGQLDNVLDPDAGAALGIAVVAVAPNVIAYYSLDGTTWTAMGTASVSSARLLAADANTRIYLQPPTGFSGTLSDALTFRAWDQTSGVNGALASTVANGGSTAFSTATDGINEDVTAAADVSQAPIEFSLETVGPNPSSGPIALAFSLPWSTPVRLTIVDVGGRTVATLADGSYDPGRYQVGAGARTTNATATPGIYFARLVTSRGTLVRRLVVAR